MFANLTSSCLRCNTSVRAVTINQSRPTKLTARRPHALIIPSSTISFGLSVNPKKRGPRRNQKGSLVVLSSSTPQQRIIGRGFHQDRLRSSKSENLPKVQNVVVRVATGQAELERIALLRARSFYVFPTERAFAGQRMQEAKAVEELERLVSLAEGGTDDGEKVTTLVALAPPALAAQLTGLDPAMYVAQGEAAVIGSLDLFYGGSNPPDNRIVRVMDPAGGYVANMCVAEGAQRRGVAQALLLAAHQIASSLGVSMLYVHTLSVNEKARDLYTKCGYEVHAEESANHAKNRGGCLDGVEGRARILVMSKALV